VFDSDRPGRSKTPENHRKSGEIHQLEISAERGPRIHTPQGLSIPAPTLQTQPAPTLVETDSLRPGYDFEKMYALLDGNVRQIFDAEKKDPVWAPEMEGRVRSDLERDFKTIGAEAEIKSLDCRTTTCRFTIEAKDKRSLMIADDFAQNFARGDYIAHDFSEDHGDLELVLLYGFSKERRPLSIHDQEYALMRKWRLERWHAAKAQGRVFEYEFPEQ